MIALESPSKCIDLSAFENPKQQHLIFHTDLIEAREMLEDYFSLRITEDGLVTGLPVFLQNFPIEHFDARLFLSSFMSYSIINWEDEAECLYSVSRSLAHAFSCAVIPSIVDPSSIAAQSGGGKEYFELHMIPLLRDGHHFYPSKSIVNGSSSCIRLTDLKELYRIFERC